MFNGKIHCFDWAIFNSFLYVYQRVTNLNSDVSGNHHPIHNGHNGLLPVVGCIPIHHAWKGVAAKNSGFNVQNRDKPSNKGDVTNNKKGWLVVWNMNGL